MYRQTGGSGEGVSVEVGAGGRADLTGTTAQSAAYKYQYYTTNGAYGTIDGTALGSLSVSSYSQVAVINSSINSATINGIVNLKRVSFGSASITLDSGSEMSRCEGKMNITLTGDGPLVIRNNDFSQASFKVSNLNDSVLIDLSGNYWGDKTLGEVITILNDAGIGDYVTINNVLTSVPQSFRCLDSYYDTNKSQLILNFSDELATDVDYNGFLDIQTRDGDDCVIKSILVQGSRMSVSFEPKENENIYNIRLAAELPNARGDMLDQNDNGAAGEEEDAFTGVFSTNGTGLAIADMTLDNSAGTAGQKLTGNLTIENRLEIDQKSQWQTALYLSTDSVLDAADVLVERQLYDGLSANSTEELAFSVATTGLVPGNYYLIARVATVNEEKFTNVSVDQASTLDAVQFQISVPEITLDNPVSATLVNGVASYHFVQKAGETLELSLAGISSSTRLYYDYGKLPEAESFTGRLTGGNGSLVLSRTSTDQDVYVLLENRSSANIQYELSLTKAQLEITSATPTNTGVEKDIIFQVEGKNFSFDSRIVLTNGSGKDFTLDTNFISDTLLTAEVASGTLERGNYSLSVVDGNDNVNYNTAITLISGGTPNFRYSITLPPRLGYHILSELSFNYVNNGTAAMEAPLVTITADQNGYRRAIMTMNKSLLDTGFWTYNLPKGYANSISFLAKSENGYMLQPTGAADTNYYVVSKNSESNSVSFYWAGWQQPWDFSYPKFHFKVAVVDANNTDPIYWPDKLKGTSYDAAYKNVLVTALKQEVGTTMGSYVAMLTSNAQKLSKLGIDADLSTSDLLQMELLSIQGVYNPYNTLVSQTDISMVTQGLSLAFQRTKTASAAAQYTDGVLGYGWTSNWDGKLETDDDGTVTVSLPGGGTYVFEPDVRGGYISFSNGVKLKKVSGQYQLSTSDRKFIFSTAGRFISESDLDGNSITAQYADDKLTSLNHSDGSYIAFEYNDDGRLNSVVDSNGKFVSYAYDDSGNLVTVKDGEGGMLSAYSYDATMTHSLAASTDKAGATVNYSYDDYGRLTGYSVSGTEIARSISYDGNSVTVTDQSGNFTTNSYDQNGRLLQAVDSHGNKVRYTYDESGNMTQMSDSNGNVISYTYDKDGHCISMTDALNHTTSYTYLGDNLKMVRDSQGNETIYTYDAHNRVTKVSDSTGAAIELTYDASGNVSSMTDVNGVRTFFTYDAHGNLISSTANGMTLQYAYDAYGNMTSYTDAKGNLFKCVYDSDSQLTVFVDAKGNKTSYAYDAAGNLVSITYANGKSETFTSDIHGNLLSWTNMRGQTMTTTVNGLGQTTKTYVAGKDVKFTYTLQGELATAGDMTFSYNQSGNLVSVSYADGRKVNYEYDKLGRMVSQSDETGKAAYYSYDAYGNLDKVTNHLGGLVVDYDFNRLGQLVKQTNGNGTRTTWQYALDGKVERITNYGHDGTVSSYAAYSYNDDGLCTQKETEAGTWTYTYDDNGQLLSEVFTDLDGDVIQEISYTYDAMGNRISKTIDGETTTYTYNKMNQIVSANDFDYIYDADGNLLEDEERTYTWTKDNRVATETLKSTDQVWEYGYDALGNRISVTTEDVTTIYTVDVNGNVLAEYVDGQQTRNYYQGLTLVGFSTGDNNYYYSADLLGSTLSVTDIFGETVNTYSYDAFGNVLDSEENIANDFEFVGGYGLMANDSGTTFVRARNYDAATGRWISMDPIGIAGGGNLYVYCGNEPIVNIDSTGNVPAYQIISVGTKYMPMVVKRLPDTVSKASKVALASHVATETAKNVGEGIVSDLVNRDVDYPGKDSIKTVLSGPSDWLKWSNPNIDENSLLYKSAEVLDFVVPWSSIDESGELIGKIIDQVVEWIEDDEVGVTGSMDPNDMLGPIGYDESHTITSESRLSYTIMCENDPEMATAPVRWLRINSTLDENLDLDTFTIDAYYIAGNYVAIEGKLESYNKRQVMTINGKEVTMDFAINLDVDTRELTIEVMAIDPATDFMLQDPEVGFLYPNDETGIGDAYFIYSIEAKDDLADGTEISSQADIYFDFNDVIPTPKWTNVIDTTAPSQATLSVDAVASVITLTMSSTDELAGIYGYYILYSTDGEHFFEYGFTTYNEIELQGEDGTTYTFSAQAVDKAGNTSEWSSLKTVTINGNAPGQLQGDNSGLSWTAVPDATGYVVEYSTDNFEHVIRMTVSTNSLDSFCLPTSTYQWRVKAVGGASWSYGEEIVSDQIDSTPQLVQSNADGVLDVFFAHKYGVWAGNYEARHDGVSDCLDEFSTGEVMSLNGKNMITDVFQGSTDINLLYLTDDANGDALFVDDIYSVFPDGMDTQARIAKINEVRAGAGNDIVDLTSWLSWTWQCGGMTVRGGLGDDVIWANTGNNRLFGDAGNDRIVGALDNDIIVGGAGDDSLHGGGGDDIFAFGGNFGQDTVEQLPYSGKLTLWFDDVRREDLTLSSDKDGNAVLSCASGSVTLLEIRNADVATAFANGSNDLMDGVSLRFGDDGSAQYQELLAAGAFAEFTSEKIFEDKDKGLLA